MNHWYTQDQLGSQRRADLDREADREAIRSLARATTTSRAADSTTSRGRVGLGASLLTELRGRLRLGRRIDSAPATHR